ncbi:hypothetical protein [Vibrio lentus]|uniref:Uncharacterized protein n=1 Tax=Vibrio lentus TaxID=136468 RepID=A0A2N7I8V7_9VIBR|nr:hypothetical protein [Vibrio lentus]PML52717.1 hypothetical protein BCT74_13840 [Vibrio lentus]PMM39170.1 hypothetical protein BCT58_23045 [Vibrio lentus]
MNELNSLIDELRLSEEALKTRKRLIVTRAKEELDVRGFEQAYKRLGVAKSTAYHYVNMSKLIKNHSILEKVPMYVLQKCVGNKELLRGTLDALNNGAKVDIPYFETYINT